MLRSILLYLSQAGWARNIITGWSVSRRAAARFIAGEKLDDAIKVVNTLNRIGINATLDHLGEHTSTLEKSRQATEEIIATLRRIDQEKVRSNVSIKLTQIGLALDETVCEENLDAILHAAVELGNFVRIDMEDSHWVPATISLFSSMQGRFGGEHVGLVIQSYLYRSLEDVQKLLQTGSRIRICKGAYDEPEQVAFPKKQDVDENFDRIVKELFSGSVLHGTPPISENGKIPPIPAIATHDEHRINHAIQFAEEAKLPKRALEFQMLHGIRRDLQEGLAERGYPVRVYVPFGTEWYPFYIRRLAERPANLWFFISNFFKKGSK
ncbi:MAG: proline dehydrogenase family protein [Chloroflexota bacterium]|nr:MAG: proline dehydrogenase family protein [Chloroflexota bacterium]